MKHCAIYTRKSTEEGLEQEFNSLDAQREACEAYIKSQKHEGWKLVREEYDDGGFSGGNMDRPALVRLLGDIAARRVDIVVVYKVDRLTRSLADFAKIVEVFDKSGASFVSITQQFNTTTSMGRLTLNMLLSFAQFEREVTSERIRDKFAASKAKGMWMGGYVPLGYNLKDRRLLINETEAQTIRAIFRHYNELGSVNKLKQEVDRLGLVTKFNADKRYTGSKPFSYGHLYHILRNPLYAGQIVHKGKTYPGLHQAIIEQPLWDQVQEKLKGYRGGAGRRAHSSGAHLLTGLLFDANGEHLTSIHTNRKGKRYRYYVSSNLINSGRKPKADNGGMRIPAQELEETVLDMLNRSFSDEKWLLDKLDVSTAHSSCINSMLAQARILAAKFTDTVVAKEFVRLLVERVVVRAEAIEVILSGGGFQKVLSIAPPSSSEPQNITIRKSIRMGRHGKVTKLIIGGSAPETHIAGASPQLIQLLVQAHDWHEKLMAGQYTTVGELAKAEKRWGSSHVSRTMQLVFLAPDIITTIMNGEQPPEMTAKTLRCNSSLPSDWQQQLYVLGLGIRRAKSAPPGNKIPIPRSFRVGERN